MKKTSPAAVAPKVPLYRALSARIEASIRKKGLKPHAPFLSHREVEKAYGSNNITVAKAMKDLVERGILYAVPYKGCYVSPVVRTRKVLIISDTPHLTGRESDFAGFLFSAAAHIEGTNGDIEVIPMSLGTFQAVHGEIRQRMPDLAGVVVFRNPDSLGHLVELSRDLPVAFFGGRSRLPVLEKHPWASRVLYDEGAVAARALEGLCKAGRRRLGVLDQTHFIVAHAMAQSFLNLAGKRKGVTAVSFDWERVDRWTWNTDQDDAVVDWARDLDGIFCTDDSQAAALYQLLYARGLRIPRDVAVIGVNDGPICPELRPALSSVRLIPEDAAAVCFEVLREGFGRAREREVAVTLVSRDSCPG